MNAQKKQPFFPFGIAANESRISISNLKSVPAAISELAGDPSPLDQQLADAFNANNDVMAYVLGVVNTRLPAIPSTPTWYTTFQTAFSNAQINANDWFPIATNLVSIPNSIVGYGIAFNSIMSTINALITVLQGDPTNQKAISALQGQIQSMINNVTSFSSSATSLSQSITTFGSNLTSDAAVLAAAVVSSTETQGVDQVQIQQFLADIADLQAEISHWQTVETAAAIAAGVAFYAGAVIAIFTFGFGLAFGIVSAAALITTMVIASQKVRAAKEKVIADNVQMNALTQQASSLAALNTQLNALIALSQAAGTQVNLVLKVWNELEAELAVVANDLANCEGDATNMNLAQLQIDLNAANADWQTLISTSTVIASISYNAATPQVANL